MNEKKSVIRRCEFCGHQFPVKPHTLNDNRNVQRRGVYCSGTCKGYAWRAKQLNLTYEQARVKWIDKLKPLSFKHEEKIFSEQN